ncbi:serine/threonine-protein kinase [Neorhodopirellula pilleata]|uniref:Tyrosine-protein kinase MasK n=1 Tax=Neorhodopirellula pilleata TaxID=2714738 RepID=A0A5C6A540_9BACT|nr:serine/threonine-protein kinase [Neorhodopirellula pilleata]TWT95044.1 Tyrosine-protein kinase MasK [Neorhodopirellula pilleata]
MILRRGFEFAPGYRLQEYIGKGQFGEVWRASGPGGVTLAAKFINLEDSSGQKEYTAIKRIKSIRQANLMQITGIWQLDYEGVVLPEPPDELEETLTNLDLDSIDAHSGFVTNPGPKASLLVVGMLLGDVSLEKYVPKRNDPNPPAPVAPGDLLRYMEGTARGLDFLNAPKHDFGSGLVSLQHCDIKPANIVLIGDSAVICDFGLARVLKRSEATMTAAAGTPAYMSPEAINGKPSCNSDQYSLAVTYYHLRTGRLPLEDGSVHKVLQTHLSGTLNFSRVPVIEREILERATHKDWRERYPSNSAFVDAIRVALTEQGLNTVGEGAGPAYGGVAVKPKRQSDGSGPIGLDTLDSEDLTDAFVQQSKGGSPIITSSSIAKTDDQMPGQVATEFLGRPNHRGPSGDVDDTFNFGSQLDAAQAAAKPQSQSYGLLPESLGSDAVELAKKPTDQAPRPTTWRKPGWWVGGGIAGLAILALTLPFLGGNSQQQPDTPGTIPDIGEVDSGTGETNPFEQSKSLIAADSLTPEQRLQAIGLFREATKADPKWLTVQPELSLDQHGGEIEWLKPIGSPMGYLTTGYDSDVRWWTWAADGTEPAQTIAGISSTAMTLRSTVIAKADNNIAFPQSVLLSGNKRSLIVGARDRVSIWELSPLKSTGFDAFPVPHAASWSFDAEVLTLTAHPERSDRIVVSLDDKAAIVVDTAKTVSSEAIIASTDLLDVAAEIRFVGSGDHLVVRQEGGDVVVYDWDEFESNRRDQSSAKATHTGIARSWVIEVPPVLPSGSSMSANLFCEGNDSGIVSVHQVFGDEPQVERVFVDDDSLQHGITTMTSIWKGADSLMLASGTEQGAVAVHVIERRDADRSAGVTFPLRAASTKPLSMTDESNNVGSPVRCLAFSSDGDWLAAGVGNEVWVACLSDIEPKMAVFPMIGESIDSLLIDTDHDRLVAGCGDGSLVTLDWSHCRLRAVAGPVRVDVPETTPKVTPPSGKLAWR